MMSALQIGPKLNTINGFDFVIYPTCI